MAQRVVLEQELEDLLAKGAVVQIQAENDLFHSTVFLTPKKNSIWRPILNLKPLTKQFVYPQGFRMEMLATILPLLAKGMWATSIDLRDAVHVPIHRESRHFLTFGYRGADYHFVDLPFGLLPCLEFSRK